MTSAATKVLGVPRSRLVWLQITDQQYHELPDGLRALVDRSVAQLVENPTADPDADYHQRSHEWSFPLGRDGVPLLRRRR